MKELISYTEKNCFNKEDGNIELYTDGARPINSHDGGWAFLVLLDREIQEAKYGRCYNKSIVAIEIIAVIKALEHIKEGNYKYDLITIKTDCQAIVDTFINKKYLEWDRVNWVNWNRDEIVSDIEEWYSLSSLVKELGNVKFIKVKSKKNRLNSIADSFAKYASRLKKDCFNTKIIKNDEKEIRKTVKNKSWIAAKKKIKWYKPEEHKVEYIDTSKIILLEETHIKAKNINLNGTLRCIQKSPYNNNPILVRRLNGEEKYALVAGLATFSAYKILNVEKIKCVISNKTLDEFVKEFSIDNKI